MSLKQNYREKIQPKLLKDLSLSNIHEVPKVVKVTVNRGLGEAATNAKSLEASVNELAQITGQKVVITRAKKAIAGFKIRQGMPIGCAVTLRGDRMYAFLERLINLALPRIRDFRGELIRAFADAGWIYHSEVTIWKDPVTAMQRTKALGLLHKQLKVLSNLLQL